MTGRLRTAAIVVAFRLGLSWLVGERYLLLTTTAGDGETVRRTVLRFRWRDGELCVPDRPGAEWAAELRRRPVAMAQAAPGPLAVAASFDDKGTVTFPPTGRAAPAPVVPDLLWVYPVVVIAVVLAAVRRRSAPPLG